MKLNSVKGHFIMSCKESATTMIDGLPISPFLNEVLVPCESNYDFRGKRFLEKRRVCQEDITLNLYLSRSRNM